MTFKDSRRCGTGYPEWICSKHGLTCTLGICKARGLVECDEHWKKEQEARQEARRKQYEEWEKRALKGAAEGDDASDTQGVILIVAERTNPSDR